MASYFDLAPQKAQAAASLQGVTADERRQLGALSLLSPQVSQLLDDLGDEHSSSGEDASLSEEEVLRREQARRRIASPKPRQDKKKHPAEQAAKPSSLSPRRDSLKASPNKAPGHVKAPPVRSGTGSAKPKPKQPNMTRFHSLRSMLFQANIQDKMMTATEEDCKREKTAANNWSAQHEQRQIPRPKTPEKEPQVKDGLGSRIKTRLRRMTSKEVPTMGQISEDEVAEFDNVSTASSVHDQNKPDLAWKPDEGDNESIHHSDVEDLVRWVSRRDPPSDGEGRKVTTVHNMTDHSGHELHQHTGHSDASTESDTENVKNSSEEEDADDLVRWISHRDGPAAGPVRWQPERSDADPDMKEHEDSDVPEFRRWFKRHDDTSGESAVSTPVFEFEDPIDEPERGRPRSRQGSGVSIRSERKHLTHDDIDELVRWVSRNNHEVDESAAEKWKRQEDGIKKKQQLGMRVDQASESQPHFDVQNLVEHARKCSCDAETTQEPEPGARTALKPDQVHDVKD